MPEVLRSACVLRPETQLWWNQAKRDFQVARRNHRSRDYDVAVFYSEQAVQEALKAVILHRTERPPPKIHNLVELGRIVGVDPSMSLFLADLAPQYIRTRYPDAAGQVTTVLFDGRTSLKFVRGVGTVMAWCRNRLR
jgi:HEPN domain-containing protein